MIARRSFIAMFAGAVSLFATSAHSEMQRPQNDVILEVSGKVAVVNDAGKAAFDRAMLMGMPQKEIRTTTAWTDGVQVFQGPLIRDVLNHVQADGSTLRAIALNDYAITIPTSDFEKYDAILALLMNGEEMSVREKGPIWIVYPRDEHRELQSAEYNEKWIWQLNRIVVE
ncbi:molybdopterin-dependent oxidoreductase [Nisaea nitritireducens]|uniref:molybdopterin-dependent oxidoreductase n=1 Tax=Nisaea nitritireducens TaxID=568392 RepID=UPI0018668F76|nr:molybdopterin-dependent oxidoreductase [Nisaea nitritireducens]